MEVDGRFGQSCIWKDKTEWLVPHPIDAKMRQWPTVMCWGMIGYGWKGTLHVWDPHTPEEQAAAVIEIQNTVQRAWQSVNGSLPGGQNWLSGLYCLHQRLQRQQFSKRQRQMVHYTEKPCKASVAKSVELHSLPEVMVMEWMHGSMSSMLQSIPYCRNAVHSISAIQTSFTRRIAYLATLHTIPSMTRRCMAFKTLTAHPGL